MKRRESPETLRMEKSPYIFLRLKIQNASHMCKISKHVYGASKRWIHSRFTSGSPTTEGLGYIKTDKMVTKKADQNQWNKDCASSLGYCADLIIRYNNLLNTVNAEEWTVEIRLSDFLTTESQDICFSDYARIHINRMINSGHERTSKNYKYACRVLNTISGSNKLMFGQLTSSCVKKWIESLRNTNRAKGNVSY